MASDDYYTFLARTQVQRLDANRAQALADLERAKADSDYEGAGAAVQTLADLDAQKQNILNLHNQYVRSQQVPEQPEVSDEEKFARPWDKMTWQDGLDLAKTSKYGKDLDANDPNVQAGFREVMARRARGE